MATSSSPGGNIPQFIAERSMPGQIYKVICDTISGSNVDQRGIILSGCPSFRGMV